MITKGNYMLAQTLIGSALDSISWDKINRTNVKHYQSKCSLLVLPALLMGALLFAGCAKEDSGGQVKTTENVKEANATKSINKEIGKASWYGPGFHGQQTANGDKFDQNEMTAAHPSLPMGTKASVTNLENGKKVQVTINDRGPYADNRAIDLSKAAAKKLDMLGDGTAKVKIETKSIKKNKKGSVHASKKTKERTKKHRI